MYVQSLSRTLLICLASLFLAACGGGGGGGGGSDDGGIIGGGGGSGGGTGSSGTISLSIEFGPDDTDQVLAGNERATLVAQASESGSSGELTVVFSTDGGTLVDASQVTSGGTARVEIIGDGVGGAVTVTASITLSDGTTVEDTLTIQASADKPELTLIVRNANGVAVTQFDSNVELTAEATLVDFDGSRLEGDDVGQSVSFEIGGSVGDISSGSALTEYQACPVVGIKQNADCAFIEFVSSTTAGAGTVTANVTINGIELSESINVENTGVSGGIPDQDSFTMVRVFGGNEFAEIDTLSLEGDIFREPEATIQVRLSDFQENPVPDGTIVNFRTELGSIDQTCEIMSGECEATFTTTLPNTPVNSGVSFKNLDDDQCPSNLIVDEQVTVSSGSALTDYRVDEILRVRRNGTTVILEEGAADDFVATANGINCVTCTNGQVLQITYRRAWLDEEDDSSTSHVLLTPGIATAPFLDVESTPCFASSRSNVVEISGTASTSGSTTVTGVGTSFVSELAPGDQLQIGNQVREVVSIETDSSLTVRSAFSTSTSDSSPERLAAPAYLGGMGQPYGGRSTILAWTQGEETFDDANGNGAYDFGETFVDLPEPFLDRNEDGVMGDQNGDSSTARVVGPYRDAGTGTDAPTGSEVREKSSPRCYGPVTVVGDANDGTDSTEDRRYCYQDGGEADNLIDTNGNGLMDVGNGIYNGSRCLEPVQNGETVCTTDLVDVRNEVLILMSGSIARTSWRASGSTGLGGTFGGGEIIQGIEDLGGIDFEVDVPTPANWADEGNGVTTPADSFPGLVFGGTRIDTIGLDTNADATDVEEEVRLFRVTNPFTSTRADYDVSFEFVDTDGAAKVGAIDVYANDELVLDDCTTDTCNFTVNEADGEIGDLLFVVGEAAGGSFRVQGTVHSIEIAGVTNGTEGEFRSTETLVSTDMTSNLTEFNVGEDPNAADANTTVFPGFSERAAPSGNIPTVFTTQRSGVFWFTDQYNGRLPEESEVKIESTGCDLVSVGGVAVTNNASDTFIVGETTEFGLSYVVTTGTGAGAITATITSKPSNTVAAVSSISCDLVN